MKKYFLLISFLIFSLLSYCQNLVPNPGFEQTVTCNYPLINVEPGEYPYSIDTSETYTPSLTHWFTYHSADYFNNCNPRFPYNYYKFLPKSGNGYVGIISINRFDSIIVEIYNAWGQQVYYSTNYQNDWYPDEISSGIYYYFIRDEFLSKEYKGWIHIINK